MHVEYVYMFARFQVIWSRNVGQDRVKNFKKFQGKVQNGGFAMATMW